MKCIKTSVTLLLSAGAMCALWAQAAEFPRTADGKPDFSGFYDIATITPLQRPEFLGDRKFISAEEAEEARSRVAARKSEGDKTSDPERDAPPDGGDGSPGAAGNVGGYNSFWIDNGDDTNQVNGEFRTSIIVEPANGRRPKFTKATQAKRTKRRSNYRKNSGTAWWLERDEAGPYDNPEQRPLAERCLLGFGSTSGPPMLPVLYNNVKQIVQTPKHVMILNEMVHDARVIRMDDKHLPDTIRSYMGDSIGHWEGDTLVVDTSNFNDRPGLSGASSSLHVVERFQAATDGTLLYSFTVNDDTIWEGAWSGEYSWPKTDSVVFEYACHEGNYALGNIMRGARILEQDVLTGKGGDE
jgi:hypothetical protein